MGKGRYILEQLAEKTDLSSEMIPGRSIIEIAGNRRVLIENHFGIKAYSLEKIVVTVSFGLVCICGQCLDILRMTKEQLIIQGEIYSITLQGRA